MRSPRNSRTTWPSGNAITPDRYAAAFHQVHRRSGQRRQHAASDRRTWVRETEKARKSLQIRAFGADRLTSGQIGSALKQLDVRKPIPRNRASSISDLMAMLRLDWPLTVASKNRPLEFAPCLPDEFLGLFGHLVPRVRVNVQPAGATVVMLGEEPRDGRLGHWLNAKVFVALCHRYRRCKKVTLTARSCRRG